MATGLHGDHGRCVALPVEEEVSGVSDSATTLSLRMEAKVVWDLGRMSQTAISGNVQVGFISYMHRRYSLLLI